jgi:hypothetical protein
VPSAQGVAELKSGSTATEMSEVYCDWAAQLSSRAASALAASARRLLHLRRALGLGISKYSNPCATV